MKRVSRCLALLLLGAVFPSFLFAQEFTDPFARDIKILTKWFAGEFDNEEQVWFEEGPRSATPEEDRHTRLHTMHRRLDLPDFGEHVFYVEEYRDNDPADVIRQRLVIFSSDKDANAIRMQQGFFKVAESVLGAYLNADLLVDLDADDVFFLEECNVYWRRVAGQFEGSMNRQACVFGEGEVRRYSVHDLTLSAEKYWRVDATYLISDDSLHIGHPTATKMGRAKPFVCNVIFTDQNGRQSIEGLQVHSQGGTADVTRESDGAEFTIRIRDKEYPYYETRPDFLFFSIRKKGELRSTAYSVNDPLSRSFGINFDGILAHCYREGYEFREPIGEL